MAANVESSKYEVLETIGRGSFGTIRKVRRISDGHVLCRKEIQYIKMSQKEREQLHAEFSILNSLKHPNIVGYYHREHLKSSQELYLYMEYCGGGDLSKEIQKLRDRNQYADEEYVWSIFAQLVAALYRCHYGVDAPSTSKLAGDNKPKQLALRAKNAVMILHRDLKPENVFLGADNSVKLGDFGLSKLMQSHDFASTYVGTPFYMSPEICAAERYTLHSDIWSLGCIMYELCARTQPFNAKTHFHLVQKIKEGRLEALPSIYSAELQNTIKRCLNTNPLKRPDTASLLQLPAVRLVRKEQEIVELNRIMRDKEEYARLKAHNAELQLASLSKERETMRADLEAMLRREWEVKAGLEINRQVQLEKDRLSRVFKAEVELRVRTEVELELRKIREQNAAPISTKAAQPEDQNSRLSNASTCAEDFPSTTELTGLSLESPCSLAANSSAPTSAPSPSRSENVKSKTPPPRQRRARGPLTRARTQLDSPMDIPMIDPSPMSIASLSLSPRRTDAGRASNTLPVTNRNIFAQAVKSRLRPLLPAVNGDAAEGAGIGNHVQTRSTIFEDDDEDGDEIPDLPSPSRVPGIATRDQVKQGKTHPLARPGILRQKTLPVSSRLAPSVPSLFPTSKTEGASGASTCLAPMASPEHKPCGFSPNRRAPPRPVSNDAHGTGDNDMLRIVTQRNLLNNGSAPSPSLYSSASTSGRTLVELAQARAGMPSHTQRVEKKLLATDEETRRLDKKENLEPSLPHHHRLQQRVGNQGPAEPLWDPDIDEMPSPFLIRGHSMKTLRR